MADNKAKLTLTVEVHDKHITVDMEPTEAFDNLSTQAHLAVLKGIMQAIAQTGMAICDAWADDEAETEICCASRRG
tara:strand:- start:18 stop:245 length:228 start_codon:yes stop_codon:yes gene_type:complete